MDSGVSGEQDVSLTQKGKVMGNNATAVQLFGLIKELAENVSQLQDKLKETESWLEQCEGIVDRINALIADNRFHADEQQKALDALPEKGDAKQEQRRQILREQLTVYNGGYAKMLESKKDVLHRQCEAQRSYAAMQWRLVKDTEALNNLVWRFRVPVRTEEELTRFLASGKLAEEHFGKVVQGGIPKNLEPRPDYERVRDFGLFLPPEKMAELKKAAEETQRLQTS